MSCAETIQHRLPFVVGIVGNRDLQGSEAALERAVADYFRDFLTRYPNTPVLLLSALAKGADQVIARAVLGLKGEGLDVGLVAVLPMSDALYCPDFSGADLTGYDELRQAACRTITLPLRSDATAVAQPGGGNNDRNLQYLLAGVFIARRCHILLAAWDGAPARGMGGTAEIVEFRRSGRLTIAEPWRSRFDESPEPYGYPPHPIELPETGPLLVFDLPGGEQQALREVMPAPLIAAPAGAGRSAEESERAAYFNRFDRIHKANLEDFNALADQIEQEDRDARAAGAGAAIETRLTKRDKESRNQLSDDDRRGLPPSVGQLADAYATADRLALDLQAEVNRGLLWGITPIFLSVLAFAAYAHLVVVEHRVFCLVGFLLLLAISYGIYFVAHPRSRDFTRAPWKLRHVTRHDDKNRYEDFRTIAEGLRVQLFWRLAGMPEFVSDYYLTRQKNELDWIRAAIGGWGLLADVPQLDRQDLARERWVVSQLVYYARSSYRDRFSHLVFRQMAAALIAVGVLTSVVLVVVHLDEHRPWAGWILVRDAVLAAILVFLIVPVLARFVLAKWKELQHEVREDEEEFRQNDAILGRLRERWGEDKVPAIKPIPNAFLGRWYAPLRWLIRRGRWGAGRLEMSSVATASVIYGLGLGMVVTAVMGLIGLGLHWLHGRHEDAWPFGFLKPEPPDWLIVAIAVNAALAAFLQWYSEKLAFGEQYRQYKRTKMTFLLANEALEPKPPGQTNTPAARIFKDLGRESLAEHADWLLLRRERPLELAWPPA